MEGFGRIPLILNMNLDGFGRFGSLFSQTIDEEFERINDDAFKITPGFFNGSNGIGLFSKQDGIGTAQDTGKIFDPLKQKNENGKKSYQYHPRLSLDSKISDDLRISLPERFHLNLCSGERRSNSIKNFSENKKSQNFTEEKQALKDDFQVEQNQIKPESQKLQLSTPSHSFNRNTKKVQTFQPSYSKLEGLATANENFKGFEAEPMKNREFSLIKSNTNFSPVGKKDFLLHSKRKQVKKKSYVENFCDFEGLNHDDCLNKLAELKNSIENQEFCDFRLAVLSENKKRQLEIELPDKVLSLMSKYYTSLKIIEDILSSSIPEMQEIADCFITDLQDLNKE
jgi:hypothetical protein